MKIIVQAKTGARIEKVEKVQVVTNKKLPFDDTENLPTVNPLSITIDTYKVSVKEQPVEGRANHAIKKALAEYFNVAPSCVTLISGQTSKSKVFEVIS